MIRTTWLFTLSLAAGAATAQVSLVDQQPAAGSAPISISTGNNVFSFANRRRADNFSLGSASSIETIRFWGGNETNSSSSLTNISGFQLTFYANDGGAPGAVLADIAVGLAATSPTPTGQLVGLLNAPMFEFTADLGSPLSLGAGDYFFSVAANVIRPVDFTNEAFQWAGSLPGDGVLFSDSFDGAGYTDASGFARTNLAFEFVGIPTPSSAAVLALAGIASTRRRRVAAA